MCMCVSWGVLSPRVAVIPACVRGRCPVELVHVAAGAQCACGQVSVPDVPAAMCAGRAACLSRRGRRPARGGPLARPARTRVPRHTCHAPGASGLGRTPVERTSRNPRARPAVNGNTLGKRKPLKTSRRRSLTPGDNTTTCALFRLSRSRAPKFRRTPWWGSEPPHTRAAACTRANKDMSDPTAPARSSNLGPAGAKGVCAREARTTPLERTRARARPMRGWVPRAVASPAHGASTGGAATRGRPAMPRAVMRIGACLFLPSGRLQLARPPRLEGRLPLLRARRCTNRRVRG